MHNLIATAALGGTELLIIIVLMVVMLTIPLAAVICILFSIINFSANGRYFDGTIHSSNL